MARPDGRHPAGWSMLVLLPWIVGWITLWVGPLGASTFEAAFQGNCHDKNPCEQQCFDLNDGTFECACRPPTFRLAADGYSCRVSFNESDFDSEEEDEEAEESKKLERPHRIHHGNRRARHRETPTVELPPPETVDGRTAHGPPKSMAQTRDRPDEASDDDADDDGSEWDQQSGYGDILWDEQRPDKQSDPDQTRSGTRRAVQEAEASAEQQQQQHESDTHDHSMQTTTTTSTITTTVVTTTTTDDDIFFGEEPSTAPDTSGGADTAAVDGWRPFETAAVTAAVGPTRPPLDVLCERFQCQVPGQGSCVQEEGRVRCICPLGRGGDHCEKEYEVRFPKFSGHSYLLLPTIRNAFKDLQLTLEFRPQAGTGVLLYSGEQSDGLGDFISLALIDGHLEFRFDCGSGEGLARSAEKVIDGQWNRVTVFRHRWDAWMQVNNGAHARGRSRGLFSRITFKEKLLIGGRPNLTEPARTLRDGFTGCVRYLEINSHVYDFRPAPKGDAEQGRGLGECSAEVCNDVDCKNGGKCIANSADSALCLCPLGFGGDYCEIVVDLIMPSFNGSSYLKYPGLGSSALSFIEMSISFKPGDPDGVILYNGLRSDGSGDFLSLSLSAGFVELRFDLGTGVAVLRSAEPVALHEWHTLFVSRTARLGLLQVDSQPRVEGRSPGAFTQLSLPQNLYVGGVPSLDTVSRLLGVRSSFRGCIQKVLINGKPLKLFEAALVGVNVDNCDHPCVNRPCLNRGLCSPHKDYFSCHCLLGFADSRCQTEIRENITFPMFMGNSFLRYTRPEILSRITGSKFEIKLRFKSRSPDGLLLWSGAKDWSISTDFVSIALRGGFVQLRFSLGSGQVLLEDKSGRVADGKWHTIEATRSARNATLKVDGGPAVEGASPGTLKQVNTDTGLYLGGVPDVARTTQGRHSSGLIGCVSHLSLNRDLQVHLVSGAQGGLNVEACV